MRILPRSEEAESLFTEVKRYCVLTRSDPSKSWKMYSLRIDEVWHQFILFTNEYMKFCERFFGTYIGHSPDNAPKPETKDSIETMSFDDFQTRYTELFGGPLPDAWYDEKSVTTKRRVLNDLAGTLSLQDQGDMTNLLTSAGEVLASVNLPGRDALAFISRTGAFYVRELPGGLTDEEQVALVATLVEHKLLRVGT